MAGILVVEDEPVVAKDIEELLLSMGYDVCGTVHSGEACLQHAKHQRPDLVLMDVRLREGLDGVETAKLLRAECDVPLIYLTAHSDDKTVDRAHHTEPHSYLLKPLRASELKSAVEMALFKHQVELRSRQREHWFSTTLNAIGDAVIAVDSAEVVTFVNPAAVRLIADGRHLVGQKLSNVLRVIDERTRQPMELPLKTALQDYQVAQLPSAALLVSSAGEYPIEANVAPIIDDDGKSLGAVIVIRDMSAHKQLRQQVALADRLASLGTLAAGVAHEINNPLTYILGNVTFVLRELRELDQQQRTLLPEASPEALSWQQRTSELCSAVSEIEEGAERVRRIVNDLRLFSRSGGTSQSTDVHQALEWALRVTNSQILQCAQLVTALEPVPPVRGDGTQIGQVFLNLLLNATQAIEAGAVTSNRINVQTSCDQDTVIITVADTGCGMDAEVIQRIFDPFFTTKPVGAGTGLGLSVCRGIVEGVGGRLQVESVPGQGSVFRVALPVATGEPVARERRPPRVTSTRGRLLVVDDEVTLGVVLRRVVGREHEVTLMTSARQALQLLEINRDFDIILCDLVMPEMSGMEFFDEVRRIWPELGKRVAFLTAAVTPSAMEFLERVSSPRLLKPFSPTQLHEFIQSLLNHAGD